MKTKIKGHALAVKADSLDDATGRFTAYAAVFDNVDSGGDIIRRGAFAKTLADWAAKAKPLPLLFNHNTADPDYNIGHIVSAVEDSFGLLVEGQIDLASPKGQTVYNLIKSGRVDQMSFMYGIEDGGPVDIGDGAIAYELRALDLIEVSVVTVGMNRATSILDVKSDDQMAQFVEVLKGAFAAVLDEREGKAPANDDPKTPSDGERSPDEAEPTDEAGTTSAAENDEDEDEAGTAGKSGDHAVKAAMTRGYSLLYSID